MLSSYISPCSPNIKSNLYIISFTFLFIFFYSSSVDVLCLGCDMAMLFIYSYSPLFIFNLCPECQSGSAFNCRATRLLPAALVRVTLIFLYILPCNSAVTQVYLSLQMSSNQVLLKRSAFYGMFSMSKQQHFPSRTQSGLQQNLTHYRNGCLTTGDLWKVRETPLPAPNPFHPWMYMSYFLNGKISLI